MSALGLTRSQLRLLDFIRAEIASKRVSPSFDEMMTALKYRSKAPIHRLVLQLERRGHITRNARSSRSISITTGHKIICDVCREEIARRA